MRLDLGPVDVRVTVYARPREGGPVEPVFACTLSVADEEGCPEAPLAEGAN
jgi:hypothetical protein